MALGHPSLFSRHNPHPYRVTHIQGERWARTNVSFYLKACCASRCPRFTQQFWFKTLASEVVRVPVRNAVSLIINCLQATKTKANSKN